MFEASKPEVIEITLNVIFYLLCAAFLAGIYHWHKVTAKYKALLKESRLKSDDFENTPNKIEHDPQFSDTQKLKTVQSSAN